MMTVVARGLEVDVGRKLHRSVWTTVRNASLVTFVAFVAFVVRAFMVGTLVVVLVACELMKAPDADAFQLVSYSLGGRFSLVHAGDKLGKNAAQDVFAFGVW